MKGSSVKLGFCTPMLSDATPLSHITDSMYKIQVRIEVVIVVAVVMVVEIAAAAAMAEVVGAVIIEVQENIDILL